MSGKEPLCPFCGAYSQSSCEYIEDLGFCPWSEAEDDEPIQSAAPCTTCLITDADQITRRLSFQIRVF